VVLIHGIPTHGFLWRKVADLLQHGGRGVIVPDLLGYGHIPTLVVWGAHDEFQPFANGSRLVAAMRYARMEVIDDAGHFLPEDAPERLADLILEFTANQEATS
jgi:pimeloyl-ACP methyl ester carboxylesterase